MVKGKDIKKVIHKKFKKGIKSIRWIFGRTPSQLLKVVGGAENIRKLPEYFKLRIGLDIAKISGRKEAVSKLERKIYDVERKHTINLNNLYFGYFHSKSKENAYKLYSYIAREGLEDMYPSFLNLPSNNLNVKIAMKYFFAHIESEAFKHIDSLYKKDDPKNKDWFDALRGITFGKTGMKYIWRYATSKKDDHLMLGRLVYEFPKLQKDPEIHLSLLK